MSNIRAITGSTRIMNRNSGGGSKLQGIPSSTNLNTTAHVAFRNRNVVCPCKREYIFCMNQLGGVGAGGIPGRSYAFAPGADGTHRPFYCGHPFGFKYKNNKHIIYPKNNIIHSPREFTLGNFSDSNITYLVIDYPLKLNTNYILSFNVGGVLIFNVLEKISGVNNYYLIQINRYYTGDNLNNIVFWRTNDPNNPNNPSVTIDPRIYNSIRRRYSIDRLSYKFTENVKLSVLSSQESLLAGYRTHSNYQYHKHL